MNNIYKIRNLKRDVIQSRQTLTRACNRLDARRKTVIFLQQNPAHDVALNNLYLRADKHAFSIVKMEREIYKLKMNS